MQGMFAHADPGFDRWVNELKKEARSRGISSSLLEEGFHDVKPFPRVLDLDCK